MSIIRVNENICTADYLNHILDVEGKRFIVVSVGRGWLEIREANPIINNVKTEIEVKPTNWRKFTGYKKKWKR